MNQLVEIIRIDSHFMEVVWQLKDQPPKSFYKKFPQYPAVVLNMLWSRGIRSESDIEHFFHPQYPDDLMNPLQIKGMKKALLRIAQAAKKNERVLIYGDYDTDGICGTIILKSLLERLGIRSVEVYLPYREKEGYGLNELAVRSFVLKNIKLLITVDCGISNYKEIALAKKLGFDVVVADHHRPPANLPPADCILDLHQKGDAYPFKDFCATGLAFKIMQAAIGNPALKKIGNLSWEWAEDFLDLVALGTIADMMPLLGENRVLVKKGLWHVFHTKRPGLEKLIMKATAVNGFFGKKKEIMSAQEVGYSIVPPLNAAGRMDHASGAYKILTTHDAKEALELADLLMKQNSEKQRIIQRMMRGAERIIQKLDLKKELVIFEGDPSWHLSLAGVVAGKLMEKYWRPAHIFRKDKKESIGGARTIPGYDLVKSMARCKNLLTKFGGHPVAAGWTCPNINLKKFKHCLAQYAKEVFPNGLPQKPLFADFEILPADINAGLLAMLEQFEPFGMKNERPRFLMRHLLLNDFETVGAKGKHLKVELAGDGRVLKGVWFRNGGKIQHMIKGAFFDVICEIERDEWSGEGIFLKIMDIRHSIV